ncbi:MAG: carboxyl transferase [Candidatus Magnetoglobus multicellularis str. Araruama]|uniref:Carboxyl transferase n=1 Tax=Candidatus Magnetoglobus multicellularis str. Araruama TaxID=890399 RepID=A0A1V1P9W4_9BACT|nr:MAG: carboxyl transferase [Candidatus Magnetoglobus multicellularis str. Araruama]
MDEFLQKRLNELRETRERVKKGGEAKISKQHKQGKLTARERIDYLLDSDSFFEINMLAGHAVDLPSDGLICGQGLIDNRPVFVYSQDRTVRGGSVGVEHGYKMYRTIERALEMKIPLIGLHDSPGARLPNSDELEWLGQRKRSIFSNISEKHGGAVFYPNTQASGIIPQISAILGSCGGISVYSPALNDFVYMVDNISHMFITGPLVVEMVTGEKISMEDLGGAKVHAQISGSCDFRHSSEKECLSDIRRLLSFIPLNCDEQPPEYTTGDNPGRLCKELNTIVPTIPNKPFDMHQVIHSIADNGDFYEIKKEFAPEIITGLARMNGKTVGIVANQPMVLAGSLTTHSSDKQARFIRFCDCYNIPLVLLVDTPAYMPGSDQEHSGIIRHGAKVLYALCEATVPRIALVLRKAYGGGNLGMGVLPGLGTDMVLYWPIMETGILGAEQSVMLLYGRDPGADKEYIDKKLAEYRETYANPIYEISSNINVQDIVEPEQTRQYLIQSLTMLSSKTVLRYQKKHGNIPL